MRAYRVRVTAERAKSRIRVGGLEARLAAPTAPPPSAAHAAAKPAEPEPREFTELKRMEAKVNDLERERDALKAQLAQHSSAVRGQLPTAPQSSRPLTEWERKVGLTRRDN
jgi:hypothetical protein